MELLKQQIEALIFCSEQSISLEEIAASLKLSFDWDLEDAEIISAITEIQEKFSSDDFAFELLEISEGYQFLTKKHYYPTVSALIQHKAKKKLSVSQMETLAIIAYRQPISKGEVEHIRGVSCDYAVQKLLEKDLIEIKGKSEGPGRPILYCTSTTFMDYFGIKSVKDLPQLKDIHVEQNEIGQPADSMDGDESASSYTGEELNEEILVSEPADDVRNYEETVSESEESLEINEISSIDSADDLTPYDRKTVFMENEKTEEEEQEEKNKEEDY